MIITLTPSSCGRIKHQHITGDYTWSLPFYSVPSFITILSLEIEPIISIGVGSAPPKGCRTSKLTFSRLAGTRNGLLALLLLTVLHIPPVKELPRTSPLGSPARI